MRARFQEGHPPVSKKPQIASPDQRDRAGAILHLQRTAGNAAVATMFTLQRDTPAPPAQQADVASSPDTMVPTIVRSILLLVDAAAVDLEPILRPIGADLTSMVITNLIANGYRDESKLADIAFWIHHPDLSGTKLDPGTPGYPVLSNEWRDLRATVVRPALSAPKTATAPAHAPAATPKAPEPSPTPGQPAAVGDDFVKDWARSTLELLPASKREEFESVTWGPLDFPGTKVYLKDLKPDQIEWYRAQSSVTQETNKAGDYFTGVNQELAGKLFLELSNVRPGGGERRVNITQNAVIPQDAFNKSKEDKTAFYDYVVAELIDIPGQEDFKLNREAAEKFAEMRTAAKADGVPIIALSTWRSLAHEEAAAKAAGNPNAVGGISHLIGLAADVKLHVNAKKDPGTFAEGSTMMPRMMDMLKSPVHKWIFKNGASYGFYQYRQEPWHWEYNPPGFRERFYANSPDLLAKAQEALDAAKPKPKKK